MLRVFYTHTFEFLKNNRIDLKFHFVVVYFLIIFLSERNDTHTHTHTERGAKKNNKQDAQNKTLKKRDGHQTRSTARDS